MLQKGQVSSRENQYRSSAEQSSMQTAIAPAQMQTFAPPPFQFKTSKEAPESLSSTKQLASEVPVPTAMPANRATMNYLPIVHDQVPSGWGVTVFDDPVIDITAYKDATNWKCVITQADQQTRQGSRLLAGVAEVTPALVSGEASCGILQTMITSLGSVADQNGDSGYYMLSAVNAHENVHVTEYRRDLASHFTTLKNNVEALTIPVASHANAAAAKTAIRALPAYTVASSTFASSEIAVANATASHPDMAAFITAEHSIVDPMIATIETRKTALSCP